MCPEIPPLKTVECNSTYGNIKKVAFIKKSDLVFVDGFAVRMKRKYGKFKREIIVTNNPN